MNNRSAVDEHDPRSASFLNSEQQKKKDVKQPLLGSGMSSNILEGILGAPSEKIDGAPE